jgi:PIN domain nuclease of toxin-antitoxin system
LRTLIDTHVLIWWLRDDPRLSKAATAILKESDNEILVSAAVGWELAIKVNLGKINPASVLDELKKTVSKEGFADLPITLSEAIRAGSLPLHHRDPFDRLLAAQAQVLDLSILSADEVFDLYGVQRIW